MIKYSDNHRSNTFFIELILTTLTKFYLILSCLVLSSLVLSRVVSSHLILSYLTDKKPWSWSWPSETRVVFSEHIVMTCISNDTCIFIFYSTDNSSGLPAKLPEFMKIRRVITAPARRRRRLTEADDAEWMPPLVKSPAPRTYSVTWWRHRGMRRLWFLCY